MPVCLALYARDCARNALRRVRQIALPSMRMRVMPCSLYARNAAAMPRNPGFYPPVALCSLAKKSVNMASLSNQSTMRMGWLSALCV